MPNLSWSPIIRRAAQIVDSYPYLITLRQLHYLLYSAQIGYLNNRGCYSALSSKTAAARRDGTFPDLLDQTRTVSQAESWSGPKDAVLDLSRFYRRDRTEGQAFKVVLGGEKATLLAQLDSWFGDRGFPIVLLKGFSSQTFCDDVARMVEADGRPAVFLYTGDFDASGVDILRDFLGRCPVFKAVRHVAVTQAQIQRLALPVNQGKGADPRCADFREAFPVWANFADQQVATGNWPVQRDKRGRVLPNVVQIEAEAIAPNALQAAYRAEIARVWDKSFFDASLAQEAVDRDRLVRSANRMK